ncbi:MAG: molybdopterin molybdotransferase MoeA [Methanocellales archaeon]
MTERFKKLTSSAEALKQFLRKIKPISRTEEIPIERAIDRVLARDIISKFNIPHYRRAAMDGFAVKALDTYGASESSPVVLKITEEKLRQGECARVHTGSPMPNGSDAVVMIEYINLVEDKVEIYKQVHPGENVGEIGEDVKKGELVFQAGHKLRPSDIGLLAAMGERKVIVYAKPTVAIIPTGEELVSNVEELKAGEMVETNGLMLSLFIEKWGGIPRYLKFISDEPSEIERAIKNNLDADLILLTGGTSVGTRDYAARTIKKIGELLVHGIKMTPGRPTALGFVEKVPVICLPGYPVACVVAALEFAYPALKKIGRLPIQPPPVIKAKLVEKIASKHGHKTYVRVKVKGGKAYPVMTTGSGILSSIAKSTGFVIIPENIEGFEAGREVEVLILE